MNEGDVDVLIERGVLDVDLAALAKQLPEHPGSAIVCTAELTPEQINRARRLNRLVVRNDGIGFALVLNWKRRTALSAVSDIP